MEINTEPQEECVILDDDCKNVTKEADGDSKAEDNKTTEGGEDSKAEDDKTAGGVSSLGSERLKSATTTGEGYAAMERTNVFVDLIRESIAPLPADIRRSRMTTPVAIDSEPGAYAVNASSAMNDSSNRTALSMTMTESEEHTNIPAASDAPAQVPHHQHLTHARPVVANGNHIDTLPLAEEYHQNNRKEVEKRRRRHCQWVVVCTVLLVALIIVIAIPVALLRSDNSVNEKHVVPEVSPPATSSPTSLSLDGRILSLLPEETVSKVLDNDRSTSPQCRAYHWLIGDPSAHQYSDERLIQRFALSTFFYALNGYEWIQNDKWLSYSHECNWFSQNETYGMDPLQPIPEHPCQTDNATEEEMYTKLWLHGNNLKGELPAEVCLLSSLKVIKISANYIHGTIPPAIGHLSELELISLVANEISGVLPTELGMLSQLKIIAFLNNRLSGTIPSQLGVLSDLEWLFLDNNQFTGSLPRELSNLRKMRLFYFYNNLLSGHLPTEIGLLSNTLDLSLDFNAFEGSIPSQFGQLSSVERMVIQHNMLSGTLPSTLGLLSTSLYYLNLQSNSITGTLPTEFGLMSIMDNIQLKDNAITGSIPSQLGLWGESLTFLTLANNAITGTLPSELALLRNMTLLHLEENNISGSIPEELSVLAGEEGSLLSMNLVNNPMLVGIVPDSLCLIGANNNVTCPKDTWFAKFGSCKLSFDCWGGDNNNASTGGLCGCGCPCY